MPVDSSTACSILLFYEEYNY